MEPLADPRASGFVTRLVIASIVALVLGLPWSGRAQTSGGIWTSASELAGLPTSGKDHAVARQPLLRHELSPAR